MASYQEKKEKKKEKRVKIPASKGTKKEKGSKGSSSGDSNLLIRIIGIALIGLLIYLFFFGRINQMAFLEAVWVGIQNLTNTITEWLNPEEHIIVTNNGIYVQ